MTRIRVAQVTARYPPNLGGVETVVKELSERLVTRGYSVAVFTVDLRDGLPQQEWINGVLVRRYRCLYGDPLYLPPSTFFRDLRSERAFIIHIHNIHTLMPLAATLLGRGPGILLQPHYHRFGQGGLRNAAFNLYKKVLRQLILPRVDEMVANSVYEADLLKEDFNSRTNISYVEEAIDVDELQSVPWNPCRPKRVLYIGKLLKYKNVDKVLAAFSCLEEKGDLRLVIVGDGPERSRLQQQAASLRINELIEWKSGLSRAELLSEYSKASVFVCLSSLESFGRGTMEALCIGLPVVAPNIGALAELAGRRNVAVVDPADAEDIARGIAACLWNSHQQGDQSHWMDWDEYVTRVIQVYERLAKEKVCQRRR